jgi:hypothetical protein
MRIATSRALLFACVGTLTILRCVQLGPIGMSSPGMIAKAAVFILGPFTGAWGAWAGRAWAARGALFLGAAIASLGIVFLFYGLEPKEILFTALGFLFAGAAAFAISPEHRKAWPTAVSAVAGVAATALLTATLQVF